MRYNQGQIQGGGGIPHQPFSTIFLMNTIYRFDLANIQPNFKLQNPNQNFLDPLLVITKGRCVLAWQLLGLIPPTSLRTTELEPSFII